MGDKGTRRYERRVDKERQGKQVSETGETRSEGIGREGAKERQGRQVSETGGDKGREDRERRS